MKPPVDAPASRARRSGDGDREALQCGLELEAAPADEGRRRAQEDDGLVGRDEAGRLVGLRARDEDGAGGDGRLGLLPGVDEATSHELGIEPAAGPAAQLAAFLAAESLASGPSCRGTSWPRPWPRRPLGLARSAAAYAGTDGATFLAAARARVAVLPACVVTSLAALPAWAVTPLAVLPGFVLASFASCRLDVTSLAACRPAW